MTDRSDWPTDGTCRKCGHCPRSPENGLCAACCDEALDDAAYDLLAALRNLAAQVGGLRAFEWEIREAAGNTNWQCVIDAVAQADTAIAKATGAS